MSASIWCYLWDLVDEGIDRVLDNIKDAGLDGISIATAYHSVEHYRIHNVRPFIFRERDASLYFKPVHRQASRAGLVPRISPLAEKGNPLKKIGAACEKRGLSLNSWTVGLHNSYLCRQRPDCAEGNIFGDNSATALCPSNPYVQEYLVALLDDLTTNYPIQRVELESFTFEGFPHFHSHEKLGMQFGETDRFLLGLCFCRCCQGIARKSGADVEAAGRFVGKTLMKAFETGETTKTPLETFVSRAKVLQPYLAAREWTIRSLLGELRRVCRAKLAFMHYVNRWTGGYHLADVAGCLDEVMLLCYGTPAQTKTAIDKTTREIGDKTGLIAGFHAYQPVTPHAAMLAEQVRTARRAGVRKMNFYNYGIMPAKNLKWLRAALKE